MKLNPDDVVLLTQIMAWNGDVPANVGGWRMNGSYAGATERLNGVLGEVAHSNDTFYVCIVPCLALKLPNSHPDYVPSHSASWVAVPSPTMIDWRYVPKVYHSRDGWRLKKDKA